MKADTLKAICELTVSLTELKLNGCPDLSVEDFSSMVFGKLLNEAVRSEAFEALLEINIDNGANAKLIRVKEEDIHKAFMTLCRPSLDWIEYEPRQQVLCGDELVLVKLRSGDIKATPEKAYNYDWNWSGADSDIVAYRIVQ